MDGDFAFSMPVKPSLEKRDVQGSIGNLEMLEYSCRFDGSTYLLRRIKSSQAVAPHRVIAELTQLKKRYFTANVRLVKETNIVADGVIGDDFTYTVPSRDGAGSETRRTRHFLANQFYYVMTVTSPPGKPLAGEASRFLSTLTFESVVKAHYARMKVESKTPAGTRTAAPGGPARSKAVASRDAGQTKKDVRSPKTHVELANSTPEDALVTFLVALAAQDAETLRAVTLPEKELTSLLNGRPAGGEMLAQLKSRLHQKRMRRLKAGDPVRMPSGESRVIQPDDVRDGRVVLWPEDAEFPSRIEKVGKQWKVFARPFIAARRAVEAKSQQVAPKPLSKPRGPG
jgi:hypothetical protein